MSAGALRLIARLAGGVPPPAALYPDRWPGKLLRGAQLAYQGWQWARWSIAGGNALLLAGDGLPAAKGPLHILDHLDGPAWRAGASVLRGACIDRVRERLRLDPQGALDLYAADEDVLVVAGHRDGRQIIVHVSDDGVRLERYAERLQCARAHFRPLQLADLLPELVEQQRSTDGVAILVQQRLAGATVDAATLSADQLRAHVVAALGPLRALQQAGARPTGSGTFDSPLFAALEQTLIAVPDWRDAVAMPLAALRSWMNRSSLAPVLVHGDYWLANLLFDEEAQLRGIIDWERSRERATPGYDAVHMVVHAFARWRGCPEWQVPCMLWDDHCEPVLERLFALVADTLGLSREDLRHVALLAWLAHLHQHAGTRASWGAERHRDWLVEPARSARRWLAEGAMSPA
jgi:aminoglycoside phosphotransferase (APT) family kinase protein